MEINTIHWHDSVILKVIELPSEDRLIFEVDYPVDWENNKWSPHTIEFHGLHIYEIHEGPFVGSPTILDATELETDKYGNKTLKIDTNAGYRVVKYKDISIAEGRVTG